MHSALWLVCITVMFSVWMWRRGKADEAVAAKALSQPGTSAVFSNHGAQTQVLSRPGSASSSPPSNTTAPPPSAPVAVEAATVVSDSGQRGSASRATVVSSAPAASAPATSSEFPTWLKAALQGALGDRYQDFVHLGAGGMGTVVRAYDTRLERLVAVKVPPPHLATHEHFQTRFLREARAIARLDHENIGRVIDVPEVEPGEIPVMILEFLEGDDLSHYLENQGVPRAPQALTWVMQAGAGLQHAHDQGILHRDVKPSNLMLVKDRVKLLDFGLAALENREGLTKSGILMGSLPYMPPEQLRGEKVGVSADVYSLAVTAFQLFTGRLPFASDDTHRTHIPRMSEVGSGVPDIFDSVLARALAPEMDRRYDSVSAFRDALQAVIQQARASR